MDSQNDGQMNVHYTPQDILNKQFKSKMRGYDQDEVDSFLDDIIKDYEAFEKELTSTKEENARLISRVDELTKQLNVSKGVAAQTPQANVAATNYDILKRLSNLERHVFGSKLSDGGAHASTPNNQRPE
ncbi:cell division regulator GpsB [Lacticaseibacillus thailandensis]|uniref:Cell cycle protein GpsB n=1 Tax=Lacticaseibacillus thailandensis DSM 22698 = JCM 13996 TaxID=1423810 RepID=A0A0R2CDM9_9LACO|nr:cell division regulator GpsB [Lacticaseibacillus thailandensis]KRM88100.1 Cell division initiation protein [Lacticaseibacillus thailandensis DSM 22698 = JCM 13996]